MNACTKSIVTEGLPLSRYRAARRMMILDLMSNQQPKRRYKKAEQPHLSIPNLLARQFGVEAPNKVWAGDITYI